MKKLFLILAILVMAVTANAWTISWDAQTGVDGYKLHWKSLADTAFTEVDVGNVTAYDFAPLNLVIGTRYEFYLTAHSQGSTSAESDHIRWTRPVDPIIIELPESPQRLVIEF